MEEDNDFYKSKRKLNYFPLVPSVSDSFPVTIFFFNRRASSSFPRHRTKFIEILRLLRLFWRRTIVLLVLLEIVKSYEQGLAELQNFVR